LNRYLALFLLAFASTLAFAQSPFCNAGFRPDGFIDLAGLPPSPTFPSSGTSAPITATLPVTGVAGLTVQVTIPAFQGNPGNPVYGVSGGEISFSDVDTPINPTLISFQFNNAIAGFGLVASAGGSRGDTFSLYAGAAVPYEFQNTADNETISPQFLSIPLVQVDLQNGFTIASVSGGGGEGSTNLANFRVQSSGAAASDLKLVPTNGLQQWLQSEAGSPYAGNASSWPDSSGNGHDATQTVALNQPGRVQSDGSACQGAFQFSGNQYFNFSLPIDGWNQMTIFLVAKSAANPLPGTGTSSDSAIFWNENAEWGNTFLSPYQTSVPFRFGTTQVGNQPVYTRPVTVGQDFTITRAEHNGATDSLWVNGLLALQQGSKSTTLNGTTGQAFIGRGLNNSYYNGEISEVLVYNRVLSAAEAASVESYLRNKFATR
jgi:hypothetical protein